MKNKKVILLILVMLVILTLMSILVVQKLKKDEVVVVNSNETVNQNVNEIVEKELKTIDNKNEDINISNWKIVVNEVFGVTFKYPRNWDASGLPPTGEIISVYCFEGRSEGGRNCCEEGNFSFGWESLNKEFQSFELKKIVEMFNEATKEAHPDNKLTGDVKEIIVDNKKLYGFSLNGSFCGNITDILGSKKCAQGWNTDSDTEIIFFKDKNNRLSSIVFPKNNKISEKILSTFQFTY